MLDSIVGTGDITAKKIKIAVVNNSLHFLSLCYNQALLVFDLK